MLADLTFTVELTEDEAQLVRLAIEGLTDEQIAAKMRGKFDLKEVRGGLHLAASLDLIAATRDLGVEWRFH